jgi:hypothetical protein
MRLSFGWVTLARPPTDNLDLVTPCPRLASVFYLIEIYKELDYSIIQESICFVDILFVLNGRLLMVAGWLLYNSLLLISYGFNMVQSDGGRGGSNLFLPEFLFILIISRCIHLKNKKRREKFPLALMGVLAPGSAHTLGPPSTLADIFWRSCHGGGEG